MEQWWRERQPMLEARGYMLRSRYQPGWTPSWLSEGNGIYSSGFEDSIMKTFAVDNIDATRISDGAPVYIKALPPFSDGRDNLKELDIALFFSSEPRRSDSRNHCVPIIDWWQIPEERTSFIVMPLLRACDSQEFLTVGEVVDFLGQIFEGVAFMHEHRIAHRDCWAGNIMMDPRNMYPNSFHPIEMDMNKDFHGRAPHKSRTDCPPRYYLIDFGLSNRFDPVNGPWPPLSLKSRGGDKTAPELNHSRDTPYNPFPTDVYYIGNLIRTKFIQPYRSFDLMDALMSKMTTEDPLRRPIIHDAFSEFKMLSNSLSNMRLRARLVRRDEFLVAGIWRTGRHFFRRDVSNPGKFLFATLRERRGREYYEPSERASFGPDIAIMRFKSLWSAEIRRCSHCDRITEQFLDVPGLRGGLMQQNGVVFRPRSWKALHQEIRFAVSRYEQVVQHFLVQWEAVFRAKRPPTVSAIRLLYRCGTCFLGRKAVP
ncbi:hypothetical protein EVG20_g2244 [Dentipellis fragilis]|uniref:Protein kinase domain-containing protein n=1 Tax=Dentipellis fragilis TaxID=205917 RepID=A0A4Y9Z7B4_9AGAM|nr:hypothetical protein EVG20_g2244 [Dentipellis fragilis]